MAYTQPDWSAMNNTADLLKASNASASNYLFVGITFMLFVVMFITLAGVAGVEVGLLGASFVGLMIAIFLVYLGLAPMWLAGAFVGLILIGFAYIIWSNRYD